MTKNDDLYLTIEEDKYKKKFLNDMQKVLTEYNRNFENFSITYRVEQLHENFKIILRRKLYK